MHTQELTLIVAATARNMGIGLNGGMPWKGLRKEMQYFARVTSRVPPAETTPNAVNAVIMGRKTWESIPPKFRPLKNRLNIILTRSASTSPTTAANTTQPINVPSMEVALQYAHTHGVSRLFVIGGAQIYEAAIRLPQAKRVLLTSIKEDYECDTFFPLNLSGQEVSEPPEEEGGASPKKRRWVRRSGRELRDWTGEGEETVSEEGQEEAGVKYEFQMWEKEDV